MRIGVVTTSYPQRDGDPAGAWVEEHARWMVARGHAVEVIAAGPPAARGQAVEVIAAGPPAARGQAAEVIAAGPPAARGQAAEVIAAGPPAARGQAAEVIAAGRVAPGGHAVEVIAAGLPAPRGPEVCAGTGDGPLQVTRIPSGLFARGGAPEAIDDGGAAIAAAGFSARLLAVLARRARGWDAAVAHWLVPSAVAVRMVAPRIPLVAIGHSGDVALIARLGIASATAGLLGGPRTRLVFVSAELRARLAAATAGPLRARIARAAVQPMGLEVARFAASARVERAPPTIAFLGRLVAIKGVDVLIDAAAALDRPARVVVAGDGPLAGPLRARAAARRLPPGVTIEFIGEVRGAARDAFLAAADIVVLPSRILPGGRTEGAPRVALEAMAAGAVVVAAAVGGLRELPAAAVTLVAPDSPAALAAALRQLLGDDAGLAARRHAGRAVAAAHAWDLVGPALSPF